MKKLTLELIINKMRLLKHSLFNEIKACYCTDNLQELSKLYGTDKCGRHRHAEHYEKIFHSFRKSGLNYWK